MAGQQAPHIGPPKGSFDFFLISHLDLLLDCPHLDFDDSSMRTNYSKAVNRLKSKISQNTKFATATDLDYEDERFLTMRARRMESFPDAFNSPVEGEASWVKCLLWSSSTFIHSALRRVYNRYYSWGVISLETINILKAYSPILEVGAGNGYWAYELAAHGIDVVATDTHTDLVDTLSPLHPSWFPVENLNADDSIQKYPGRALLMCWPHGYALGAIERFAHNGGKTVIIIGDVLKRFDRTCLTDDPFGGVNKSEDSDLMFRVREQMNLQQTPQNEETNRHDKQVISNFVKRHSDVRCRWKLVSTSGVPQFVTTEEDEAICDQLSVYQLSEIESTIKT